MNLVYLALAVIGVLFVCAVAWLFVELKKAPLMPSDDNDNFYKANEKG
jgi:hypothetical protein